MGYNTEFTLYAENGDFDALDLYFQRGGYYFNQFYPAKGTPTEHLKWWGGSCTWYEHDDDMLTLSRAFPDVLFTLEGVGEEHPDIWKTQYKNGEIVRKQRAVITFNNV